MIPFMTVPVLDRFSLTGKVALVTGVSIGRLGQSALTVETDVTDPDAWRAAVEAAVGRFGQLDVLINNAGLGTAVPALRETPEQFREVIEVNLLGAYWMAQAAAHVMRLSGMSQLRGIVGQLRQAAELGDDDAVDRGARSPGQLGRRRLHAAADALTVVLHHDVRARAAAARCELR